MCAENHEGYYKKLDYILQNWVTWCPPCQIQSISSCKTDRHTCPQQRCHSLCVSLQRVGDGAALNAHKHPLLSQHKLLVICQNPPPCLKAEDAVVFLHSFFPDMYDEEDTVHVNQQSEQECGPVTRARQWGMAYWWRRDGLLACPS